MPTHSTILSAARKASARANRLGFLVDPFHRIARWFYYLPRPVQVGMVLLVVLGTGVGINFATSYTPNRQAAIELGTAGREFDTAVQKGDINEMKWALDKILALNPNDANAKKRRNALEKSQADPEDASVAVGLMHHHILHNRVAEAAREAGIVHAKHPKDWEALYLLALNELANNKDRAAAEKWLDKLPDPEDPQANLDVSGLLSTLSLYKVIGRDGSLLRRLIVRRLLPFLRGSSAQEAAASDKAKLLECYLEPFDDPIHIAELASYWAVAAGLADSAVAQATKNNEVPTLSWLGSQSLRMHTALDLIRDNQHMGREEYATLAKEVDHRSQSVWEAVRKIDPRRPEAYLGLARLAADDKPKAQKILLDGLTATGDHADILKVLIAQLATTGNAREALQRAVEAHQKDRRDPRKLLLVALAARACNTRDRAIEACEAAIQIDKNYLQARLLLANLCLENGKSLRAMNELIEVGEAVLCRDPDLLRMYGRTLVESGLPGRVREVLAEVEKVQPRAAPPQLPVAFLRGVIDARVEAEPDRKIADRANLVANSANELLTNWPDDPSARRLKADAIYRQAEVSEPRWPANLVRESLREYNALPISDKAGNDRTNPEVVAAVASLRLKAEKNPASALSPSNH